MRVLVTGAQGCIGAWVVKTLLDRGIEDTDRIKALVRDAGWPVRVVYASSAAVWGSEDEYGDRKLSEQDLLKPATHYGVLKQANEGNARVFHSLNGISSIGIRPWSVYGVGRDAGLTADPTHAMKSVVLGNSYQIRVTGYMDLQYVEDVAETFVQCRRAEGRLTG